VLADARTGAAADRSVMRTPEMNAEVAIRASRAARSSRRCEAGSDPLEIVRASSGAARVR
jgi:hypothetical protein